MITVESWQGLDLNDTTYQSWLAIDDAPYSHAVGVVQQSPLSGPPRFVRSQMQMRTLPVHVNIIDGDFQAGWETLNQKFRPGTRGELVVMFAGSVRRAIDATVQQVIPYEGSPNRFTVILHGHDPRWRSEDVQRTSQAVTASPTTWAITNDGNTPDDAPIVRLQPYTRKAQAAGQRYVREVVIANRLARAFTNYAIELTNGGWDHAAAVSAGTSDTSGKDVRVLVDGVEVPRWDGEHASRTWNTSSLRLWSNIDLAQRRTVTLRTATTATSPLNGEDLEVYDGQIDALPERGAILIDDEVIEYAGKTARNANGLAALQNVIRGARNTTAAIHALDATGYFVEHRVQIVHGWTGAGTVTEDPTTKPLLDLTSSTLTNTRHEWTDFTDSRYPGRSMGWKRGFASRDDQSGKIVAATGGPLGAMAAQFYANGAQASKPVANQWERAIPSGLATSASALSFVNTRSADMGLQTIGVDADGNEVVLDTKVGTASGATVNITPAAALYDVRFWTFNPILSTNPGTAYSAVTITTTPSDVGQRIVVGDEPVVLTDIIASITGDGSARAITLYVLGDNGGTAPVATAVIATSGSQNTAADSSTYSYTFTFASPPTLAARTAYWICPGTAAGTPAIRIATPPHGTSGFATRAAATTATTPTYALVLQLLGYRGAVAPTLERIDTNATPTDANSTSIASVTAVLDSAGVPYVSMRGQQDAYVVAGTLRNVTTGQGLAFATAGALLDRYEVDVRERAVRDLAECPYALTLSGNEITDLVRVTATQGDGRTAPDGSIGIWPAATNLIANGNATTNTTGITDNSSTTSRVTSGTVKFGSTAFSVISGNATANEGPSQAISGGASSTQYTVSAWVWLTSGAATVRAVLSDSVAGKQGGTPVVLTSTPQRVTVTATTGAAAGSFASFIETTVQQVGTWRIGGWQVETGPIATPYIQTDGGTASRTAARVRIPVHDLFTEEQGWCVFRLRAGRASTDAYPAAASEAYVFSWREDNNNRIGVAYASPASSRWQFTRLASGSGTLVNVSDTFARDDALTVAMAWEAAQIKGSIDGAAFTTQAQTAIPVITAQQAEIGTFAGTSAHLAGDVLWAVFGRGTLTNTDAATLHAYGNTDPDPAQLLRDLSPESMARALWWADGNRFFRLDRPADERGSNVVATVTPDDEDDWLRLDPGANRLAWEESGIAGQGVEVLMHDRWS